MARQRPRAAERDRTRADHGPRAGRSCPSICRRPCRRHDVQRLGRRRGSTPWRRRRAAMGRAAHLDDATLTGRVYDELLNVIEPPLLGSRRCEQASRPVRRRRPHARHPSHDAPQETHAARHRRDADRRVGGELSCDDGSSERTIDVGSISRSDERRAVSRSAIGRAAAMDRRRAGPRESHRRAHRLQRRLRAADGDRSLLGDRGRRRSAGEHATFFSDLRRTTKPRFRSPRRSVMPRAGIGRTTSPA